MRMDCRGAVDPMGNQNRLPKDPRRMGGGDGMAQSRAASSDLAAFRERDELLATKVGIPRTRPDRLARARLFQRLNQGMARELILVCTPAGFGKTTLLADWAAGATLPVAWLSLDPDDNDPMRFWRYVVAALDRVVGGLGEQVVPLLSPGGGTSTHGVVTTLINRLQDQPGELALDLHDCAFDEDGPTPLDCALWGLHNNRADDGDYPGTVQALLAAGAPTRQSPPTGDETIDALLATHTAPR
jgi:hypothetical protein